MECTRLRAWSFVEIFELVKRRIGSEGFMSNCIESIEDSVFMRFWVSGEEKLDTYVGGMQIKSDTGKFVGDLDRDLIF